VGAESVTTKDHAAAVCHGPIGAVFFGPDNHVIDDAHHAPAWVKASPFFAMLIGLAVAYWFYIVNPEMPKALARPQPVLYRFLLNTWSFGEIYDFIFVRPARWLGTLLWKGGDGATIDGTLNGVAMGIVPWFTRLAGRAQSGYLFHYAFAMVIGLVVLTLWLGIRAGR
jgi:NADH-quinone oxidoreductase subunit L